MRPSWDEYFMAGAEWVATRSTCPRASVGAIIVKDKRILSTGYNGAVSGAPHCTSAGCLIENGHCERAIHAEVNAVCEAARRGVAINGATLYYWDSLLRGYGYGDVPCRKCDQVMRAAGIVRVVFKNRDGAIRDLELA